MNTPDVIAALKETQADLNRVISQLLALTAFGMQETGPRATFAAVRFSHSQQH